MYLDTLPLELWFLIIEQIPYYERKELRKTNQFFYLLINQTKIQSNQPVQLDMVYWILDPDQFKIDYFHHPNQVNALLGWIEKDYLKQLITNLPCNLYHWKILFQHSRIIHLLFDHHYTIFSNLFDKEELEPLWLELGCLPEEKILVLDPTLSKLEKYIEYSILHEDKKRFDLWCSKAKRYELLYILPQQDLDWVLENYSYDQVMYEEMIRNNFHQPSIVNKILQKGYQPTIKLLKHILKYNVPKKSLLTLSQFVDINLLYKLLRQKNKHLNYETIFINKINDLYPLFRLEMYLCMCSFESIMNIDIPLDRKVKKLYFKQMHHLKNNCTKEEMEMLKVKFT
jgi:hypothetical protein